MYVAVIGYLATDLAESEFNFCAPGIIGGSMLWVDLCIIQSIHNLHCNHLAIQSTHPEAAALAKFTAEPVCNNTAITLELAVTTTTTTTTTITNWAQVV